MILLFSTRFRLNKGEDKNRLPLIREESVPLLNMKSYGGLSVEPYRRQSNGKSNGKSLGKRLETHCKLMKDRRMIVDIVCGLALLGILLMMTETELFIFQYTNKRDLLTQTIKVLMSISTVFLLIGICVNYYIVLRIEALGAGVKDWTAVIKNSTLFWLFIELLVCSIHPFPGAMKITYTAPGGQARRVSIDAVLSILMMMRLYLIAKFAVVHSRLLTDTSTNSIGALSKIKINTLFVFKAAMTSHPSTLLVSVMATTFLVNSWAMRTCEIYYKEDAPSNSYLESMWLVATTFLTVGYGDKIPQSYCGRYISVSTGIIGVGTTALLVAILARQLEQTRSEKYVFNMVTRIQIEKQRKVAAANIIKSTLRIRLLKRYMSSDDDARLERQFQDQLKTSVRQLKAANLQMAHVGEFNVGIIEVSETVNRIGNSIDDMVEKQEIGNNRSELYDQRLSNIESKLDEIRAFIMMRK